MSKSSKLRKICKYPILPWPSDLIQLVFVEKKENTGKSEKIPEIKKTFNKWVQNEKNGRKWGEKKN